MKITSINIILFHSGVSEPNPGAIEHIIMAVYAILQLVINSSHLATNIMMMVSYHHVLMNHSIFFNDPFILLIEKKNIKLNLKNLILRIIKLIQMFT